MFHEISIIGNLGRDPELRYSPNGDPVTNFQVATSRKYKNAKDELVTETAWFRVVVWGKQAENANQYLAKGNKVFVRGTLVVDPATGGPKVYSKSDGSSGANFEVRANQIVYLTPKANGAPDQAEEKPKAAQASEPELDYPF